MAKYDEVKGFTRGISDEEFETLLNISFTLNEFQVERIRRSSLVPNDFLLGLSRVEKRFLRGEKKYNYVAYVDRKRHEFSDKWMSDFWNKVNSNEISLYSRPDKEIEKIFILSIDKIKKKDIAKNLKNNIQFCDGNGFFDFLFNNSSENTSLASSLYSEESKKWDAMSPEQQKSFCENIGIDYIKFERLWKYPIGQQSKLIIALQGTKNRTNDKKEQREREEKTRQEQKTQEEREKQHKRNEYANRSESTLKKFYDVLDIGENATSLEIKNAYRNWIKFYHPDKFENKPPEDKERALIKTKKIREAYEELRKAGKIN
jgi:hypothetical protein